MSDKKDFKALFRAAKAGRDSSKLSKEQLRAIKAQRAAAAVAAAASAAATAALPAEPAPPARASAMPPPPPRQPAAGRGDCEPATVPYNAESQGTRLQLHDSGSQARGEVSVNQPAHAAAAAAEVASAQGESPTNQGAAVSAGDSRAPTVPAGFFEPPPQPESHEFSGEGSTGAAAGKSRGDGTAVSRFSREAGSAAPYHGGGGFEDADDNGGTVTSGAPQAQPKAGAIPKGFFEDKEADARARGEEPKQKEKDAAKEYAAFMRQIEEQEVAGQAEANAATEADAADREVRDEFQQFVRRQKVEQLKESRARGARPVADEELFEELIEQAAPAPALAPLPKRRRVMDTVSALEAGGLSSDEDGEEGGPEDLLDWRAKSSAF